jgi:anti-sigma factor RsiW
VSEDPRPAESDLQAYADGQLAPAQRLVIDAWLAGHPEDAERIESYQRIGQELRGQYDAVLEETVPVRLRRAFGARRRWRPAALAACWMVLGAALGAVAGYELHAIHSPAPLALDSGTLMARRAALAHVTYSPEVRHPVEVGADQEQHLIAWLSKRLNTKVRAPKLDEAGLALVGGRLLPGENGPVAQFMYQTSSGRRATLYVRTEARGNRETAFRFTRENNVSVFYWIDRECGYALASADLGEDELKRIAILIYKQLES